MCRQKKNSLMGFFLVILRYLYEIQLRLLLLIYNKYVKLSDHKKVALTHLVQGPS